MKKQCLLIVIIIMSYSGFAQISIFEGRAIANPQTFGERIYKSINDGDNLMQQGEFEDAIMAYDNAVAQNPTFAEAYVKRAIAKYRIGREYEARQDMQYASSINPYAGDLFGFKGTLSRLNVLAFHPLDYAARPSLSYTLDYYLEAWNIKDTDFNESTVTPFNSQESTDNKSIIVEAIKNIRSGNKSEALQSLEDVESKDAMIYDLMGIILIEQHKWTDALKCFDQVIVLKKYHASAYYFKSIINTQLEQYEDALALVDTSIIYRPDLLKAYFHKAALLKKLDQPKEALSTLEFIEEEDDRLAYELNVNMAIVKKIMGQPLEAIQHINKAMDISTNYMAEDELFKLRGNLYLMIDEPQRAIDDYSKAIELNNNFADAYFNRAMANIIIYNKADACYDLERSFDLGYEKAAIKMSYFCVN